MTELAPIGGGRVLDELERIAALGEPVSLYIHIPFCRSSCWHPNCHAIPTHEIEAGACYVEQLAEEASLLSAWIGRVPVTELAIGGGSPNILSPLSLRRLTGVLNARFSITPGARRSIELDPRTTTSAQLDTLAGAGFGALSLGIYDFSQTEAQTRSVIERARARGFDDINLEVVYGTPGQTELGFMRTLDAIIALAPDRIALAGDAQPANEPPSTDAMPDSLSRATLLLLAVDQLTSAGYVHVGLDHFAKPGSPLARAASARRITCSVQGYHTRLANAVIGLGTSAISSTPRMQWQNHGDLAAWQRDVAAATLPIARGMALDADDRIRRAVIERLMCDGQVDLGRLGREHGIDAPRYFASELQTLARLGALAHYHRTTHTLGTTELGRMLVRNVCAVFDRYRRPAGARNAAPQLSLAV